MNYELAKQLKDAGFPQTPKYGELYYDEELGFIPTTLAEQNQKLSITKLRFPTLSELIEACGDEFGHLAYGKEWLAMQVLRHIDDDQIIVEGKTPEEAVAKLWLALNASPKGSLT